MTRLETVVKAKHGSPTGSWRNKRPVVDQSKCTKCKICQTFCPDSAIYVLEKGATVNYEYCKGCLICVNECPVKCISIQEER